jgi:hypothetical protein
MNEKQNLENIKDLKIKDIDIATVEAMHDLLLEKGYLTNFITLQRSRNLTAKMHNIINSQKMKHPKPPKTILEESNDIIFNRAEEKQREYGPIDESLEDTAIVASIISNESINIEIVYAVLMGLKISRMRWNKKHDTFLDSIGYTAAYEAYLRKNEKNEI